MDLKSKSIDYQLRLEELAMFLGSILVFNYTMPYTWWQFLLCFLLPDIGMLGYLINARVGAFTYNFLHSKTLAILIYGIAFYYHHDLMQFVGIILFAHSSMDRIVGYGLKYADGFKHTHLGTLK